MNNKACKQGISFVIVCYKSQLDLASLVTSIIKCADISHELLEIIVVDNWGKGDEQKIVNTLAEKYNADFIYKKSKINGGVS